MPVTVVPGLSSAISVPGLVGIPVTHRGVAHEFTVISGHLPPDHPGSLVEWDAVARMRGTVVLLMAVQNLPAIAARLVAAGRPSSTPVAVVADGSMPTERTVWSTLAQIAEDLETQFIRPPAIVVVGEVVAVANPQRYATPGAGPAPAMAEIVEITDPADPRLRDYRDLRDVQLRTQVETEHGLFLAEGEKVVRRAAEAGFEARSFLMAPRWLDGLATVLEASDAPATSSPRRWRSRSPASTCTAARWRSFHRRPLPSVAEVLDGARTIVVLEDIIDHTNVGAALRNAAGLGRRRRAARAALRGPALPPRGQGRDGHGVLPALDPPARLVRRPAVAGCGRLHHRRDGADRRRRRRGRGGRRGRPAGPGAGQRGARAVRHAGSRPRTGTR